MTALPRLAFAALLVASLPLAAQIQTIESPAHRVVLVELFTSEGCSSCPPADRWVSALKSDPGVWTRFVPVAFHVDYWDYIGWKDRFAEPAFSKRQRGHARAGNVGSVYTPGFLVHGEEWRGWFRRPVLDLATPPPAGVLRLDVNAGKGVVGARYTAAEKSPAPLDLHLAVLGFELSTEVKAGENTGRTLEHDFVVLGYDSAKMSGASPRFFGETGLPKTRVEAPRRALAAWVTRRGDLKPLQAAGGWLE